MNKTALILAALLLAACARQSAEPPLGRQLAGLSSAQRDAEGHKAAQMLRRANRDDDPDVAVRDIRYRAADDTFVYTVVLKRLKNTHGITPAARRRAQAEMKRGMVRESCRRRAERDILTQGRYALEFHVLAADGRPVAAPFRITGKDC